MTMSDARKARYGALIRAAQNWHRVEIMSRAAGNISNAEDERQVVRRIQAVLDLVRLPSDHEHHISDDFIRNHRKDSANEFVAGVSMRFGGKLPGPGDMRTPAQIRQARQSRRRG